MEWLSVYEQWVIVAIMRISEGITCGGVEGEELTEVGYLDAITPQDAGVSGCFNSLLYCGVNATFTTGGRSYLYSHPPLTFSFEES